MSSASVSRPASVTHHHLPFRSSSVVGKASKESSSSSSGRDGSNNVLDQRPSTAVGLGLNIEFDHDEHLQRGSKENGKQRAAYVDEGEQIDSTPKAAQFDRLEAKSKRQHPRQMVTAGSEGDNEPLLDMALQFVGSGPMSNFGSGTTGRSALNARRRGRAMYLNDQLQFNAKTQAKGFHSTLKQWHDQQGKRSDLEDVEGNDLTVLLAQARSMAETAARASLESLYSHGKRPNQSDVPGRMRKTSESRLGMRTSASTPEGALGKLSLPLDLENTVLDWKNVGDDDGLEVLSVLESEGEEDKTKEADVLRAGLRFVIGCYDDLAKQREQKNGLSNAVIASMASRSPNVSGSSMPGSPIDSLQQPRQRSRSRSILKTLAKKSASLTTERNRLSFATASSRSSVLEPENPNYEQQMDQVSGPSNRYGMPPVSQHAFPSDESNADSNSLFTPSLTASTSKLRLVRSRTGSNPLSSPMWGRRNGAIDSPSVKSEMASSPLDMDQASLSAALHRSYQQLNQMEQERKKTDQEMEGLSESLFTEANEMVRKERIKSTALERELDTLRAVFSAQDGRQTEQVEGVSDIERGAKSEEEEMMMAAVAQAARETAESEEREAEWKEHCEHLQQRVDILEEALFQAMGLLADKEEGGEWPLAEPEKEHNSQAEEPPASPIASQSSRSRHTSPDAVTNEDASSDCASDFYSAAEEDEERAGSKPYVSLARNSGSFFTSTLARLSRQTEGEEGGVETSMSDRGDSKSIKTAGSLDTSPSGNDDVSSSHNHRHCEEVQKADDKGTIGRVTSAEAASTGSSSSPRSSTSGAARSRRDSNVSSIRHSVLPPKLPHPTSPLPTLPDNQQQTGFGSTSERDDRIASMPSPALVLQTSSPAKKLASLPLSRPHSPQRRASTASEEQSNTVFDHSTAVENPIRRAKTMARQAKIRNGSNGLPLLSTAGSLITSSPGLSDAFGGHWATKPDVAEGEEVAWSDHVPSQEPEEQNMKTETGQRSMISNTSLFRTRQQSQRKSSASFESATNATRMEPKSDCADSVAESLPTAENKSMSSKSVETRRSEGRRKGSSNKHSILGHMPPMPSSVSASSGLSRQSSLSLCSDRGSIDASHSPTMEHYRRLHRKVSEDGIIRKEAQFSRKTRFNEARQG